MTLWRYRSQPFTLLDRLLDEMAAGSSGNAPVPQADADGWTIQLPLPGIAPDAIELTVDGRTLTVSVDARTDQEREEGSYQGAMAGQRAWSWALPDGVDAEQVRAMSEHGMLTIRVPKAESAKPRRIEVSGSSGARQVSPTTDQDGGQQKPQEIASGG